MYVQTIYNKDEFSLLYRNNKSRGSRNYIPALTFLIRFDRLIPFLPPSCAPREELPRSVYPKTAEISRRTLLSLLFHGPACIHKALRALLNKNVIELENLGERENERQSFVQRGQRKKHRNNAIFFYQDFYGAIFSASGHV